MKLPKELQAIIDLQYQLTCFNRYDNNIESIDKLESFYRLIASAEANAKILRTYFEENIDKFLE